MISFDFDKFAQLIPRGDHSGEFYTKMPAWDIVSEIPIEQILINNRIQYYKKQVARTAWILDVNDPDWCLHVFGKQATRGVVVSRNYTIDWYNKWDQTVHADVLRNHIIDTMQLNKEQLKLLRWKKR